MNKKLKIFIIIVILALIGVGIYFYMQNSNTKNDKPNYQADKTIAQENTSKDEHISKIGRASCRERV